MKLLKPAIPAKKYCTPDLKSRKIFFEIPLIFAARLKSVSIAEFHGRLNRLPE